MKNIVWAIVQLQHGNLTTAGEKGKFYYFSKVWWFGQINIDDQT
jgi:hypothetical protein